MAKTSNVVTKRVSRKTKAAPSRIAADAAALPHVGVAAVKPPARAAKRTPRKPATVALSLAEERHHLIEVAAYYIAEQRGFCGESLHEDWLQAEREIDAMIAAGKLASRAAGKETR